MNIVTYEGIVEKGKIRLKSSVRLPDKAKVYVIVPSQTEQSAKIISPRLARSEQVADFAMEISEDDSDAKL